MSSAIPNTDTAANNGITSANTAIQETLDKVGELQKEFSRTKDRNALASMLEMLSSLDPDLAYGPTSSQAGMKAFYNFEKKMEVCTAKKLIKDLEAAYSDVVDRFDPSIIVYVHHVLCECGSAAVLPYQNLVGFLDVCHHRIKPEDADASKRIIIEAAVKNMPVINEFINQWTGNDDPIAPGQHDPNAFMEAARHLFAEQYLRLREMAEGMYLQHGHNDDIVMQQVSDLLFKGHAALLESTAYTAAKHLAIEMYARKPCQSERSVDEHMARLPALMTQAGERLRAESEALTIQNGGEDGGEGADGHETEDDVGTKATTRMGRRNTGMTTTSKRHDGQLSLDDQSHSRSRTSGSRTWVGYDVLRI